MTPTSSTRTRRFAATVTNHRGSTAVTLTGEFDQDATVLLADILSWLYRDGHLFITLDLTALRAPDQSSEQLM